MGITVDNYRLKIKMGAFEFEAEGPRDSVDARFADFKSLIKTAPPVVASNDTSLLYRIDRERSHISLRVLPPSGDGVIRQTANAILLLLLGYNDHLSSPNAPVLALAKAIRESGLTNVKRLSTAFPLLQKDGLALKKGSGKGTYYQISNPGISFAKNLSQTILSKVNL